MHKMMACWISLALLAVIAYVSGITPPRGCSLVTSTSFRNTSRSRFSQFCKTVNDEEYPNRTWIGIKFIKTQCTICCAGINTTGHIHYNVSTLSKTLGDICKKRG
uniref:Putative metastriate ixostatin family member n=1 Tax=Rhipicephalus pulchellus TaxID=72859 RepID=L7M9W6_RHIPC